MIQAKKPSLQLTLAVAWHEYRLKVVQPCSASTMTSRAAWWLSY
jgi:hypothetical protein